MPKIDWIHWHCPHFIGSVVIPLAAVISFLSPLSLGQEAAQKPPASAPTEVELPQAPASDSIYLREDDEETLKAFREARTAVAARRFDEAVDRYQSVIDRCVDQLVPWSVETLESARQAAKKEIASGPAELRQAYVTRLESRAREELAAARGARSESRLRAVADRFPFTGAGIEAETWFGALALERGENGAAFASFHRLVDALPATAGDARAAARAKAALALELLGETRARADWAASTPAAEREQSVSVRGESRKLDDYFRSLALAARPRMESRDWSGFLGGNSRSGAAAFPAPVASTLTWVFDHLRPIADLPSTLDDARVEGGKDAGLSLWRLIRGEVEEGATAPPIQPVIVGRTLFAYNARRAFAVDVATGKALWYRDLADFGEPAPESRRSFLAAASADLVVLVHETVQLVHETVPLVRETVPSKQRRRLLVALSARDGSTRWIRGGDADGDEAVKPLLFTGAPVIAEGAVMLGAKALGNELKAYAVAFEADTGDLRFLRFLGSGPAALEFRGDPDPGSFPTASYAAGRLFVGTGIGIVSALDPGTGEHLWCYRYERIPFRSSVGKVRTISNATPWLDDPLVAANGRLYTTPQDAGHLYVLLQEPDRATGLVALARREKENLQYLIGVREGVVFLAGNDRDDWTPQVVSFRPEGGPEEEAWPPFPIPNLPEQRSVQSDVFVGRGTLAGEVLLVPTRKTVYVISSRTGEFAGEIRPRDLAPQEIPRSGNVAVSLEPGFESVFTASSDQVLRFQKTP